MMLTQNSKWSCMQSINRFTILFKFCDIDTCIPAGKKPYARANLLA